MTTEDINLPELPAPEVRRHKLHCAVFDPCPEPCTCGAPPKEYAAYEVRNAQRAAVLADRAQRQAVPQGETVSVPRKLAERIVGLLAQECAPCADPACRITDNPEKAITECREQLWATLSASPTPPASAVGVQAQDTSGVAPIVAWLVPMLNAKPRLFTDLAEARAFCAQQNGMVYPQPLIVAPGYPYRALGVGVPGEGK